MTFTLILCGATCLFMILSIFLYPTVKVGKLHLDSYVLAALTGALVLLCSFFAREGFPLGIFLKK